MELTDLIRSLSLGAFIGCFTGFLVAVFISFLSGPQNVSFSGVDVINWFFGCIIVGWGFSISGLIYTKEDLALPFQVAFQMIIGFIILFLVAIYLN